MAVPVIKFPTLMMLVRLMGVTVAALVLTWTVHFRGGLALLSDNKDLIFNVHPVLMVIGLVLLNGEGKYPFCALLALVLCVCRCGEGIDNFYSLHSWLGLACLLLFAIQWAAGFVTFWYPGGSRNSRATLLPWHVFFGVYIYALAVVTATTGILEKATFLQTNKVISHYSAEALLVNSLGILMIVLGGFVVLATITSLNSKGDIPRNATE
ncbi:hypothetical protein DKX38_006043 [Salix brachista]|uniref:Cytochrome b561 domain-containing protein n=1 Tax=Salix brachista TaxID=2182728 RepID=A0A5N5N4B3_9ROSI|nr:hypothetical protein DKX38_006043 [Salix brachista]